MFKILIVKNRYKKKLDFKKGIKYFSEFTPLNIQVDEVTADFDLEFKHVYNERNKAQQNVVPTGYYDIIRSFVPENKYNAIVLVYGNKAPGIRVSIAEDEPLYADTDVISLAKVTDGGKVLNHELFHCFFKKIARKGIYLQDPMDTYFMDNALDANPSNRTIALEKLAPYWKMIESMNTTPTVTIKRYSDDGKQVLGFLTMEGFQCKTLERPWKDNAPNISCIPKGTYNVVWSFSPKFMKYTYEIQNVTGRSGIRIHPANFFFSLQGCIALGDSTSDINSDGTVDILNSTVTLDKFQKLLNKKPFILKIV